MPRADTPPRLRLIRALIDCTDAGLLLLWSGRRRLAGHAAGIKHAAGLPLRDHRREDEVHRNARRLSRRLDLPAPQVDRICDLLIADACNVQRVRMPPVAVPACAANPTSNQETAMNAEPASTGSRGTDLRMRPLRAGDDGDAIRPANPWLRLLPPPSRLAPLLRRVPGTLQGRLLRPLLQQALAPALAEGRLDALCGRRIGIAVTDLGIGWTLTIDAAELNIAAGTDAAESVVHGDATDLLLLASRLQDADTLFFKRQLRLTGDVELGLTARNLLDQLPFESLPLALRILLHRAARLAESARRAHRGRR